MNPSRIRIRFSKSGDLRLISHRDMVRMFERLFRRVGAPLAMTQGFHPRPRMTFPDALALGVVGLNEIVEVVLATEVDAPLLCRRMVEQAPAGLTVHSVRVVEAGRGKARVARLHYELPLPPERLDGDLADAIARLRQVGKLAVERRGKQVEIDVTDALEDLRLDQHRLLMAIRVAPQSQLQPRDILAALQLRDVLADGAVLTRTQVELCNEDN
jgi:radical SAM-linked protein